MCKTMVFDRDGLDCRASSLYGCGVACAQERAGLAGLRAGAFCYCSAVLAQESRCGELRQGEKVSSVATPPQVEKSSSELVNRHWTAVLLLSLGTGLTALGVNIAVETAIGLRLVAVFGLSVDAQFLIDPVSVAVVLIAACLCAAATVACAGAAALGGRWWLGAYWLAGASARAALLNALGRSCQLVCQAMIVRYLAMSTTTSEQSKRPAAVEPLKVEILAPEASSSQEADAELEAEEGALRIPNPIRGGEEEVAGPSGRVEDCDAIGSLVTDRDLAALLWRLEASGGDHEDLRWESVVAKESPTVKYSVRRRDPEDGSATEYLSTTQFSDCSPEVLRDFYMDSEYLCSWDSIIRSHRQVALCHSSGVEVGQFVKKYPLCSAREYVLASKLWAGPPGVYYCFTRAVEHSLVPHQQKLRRVDVYESMWRIRAVPGTSGAEIKLYMQEDSGMPKEIAKMGFKRGIWGYVKKTEQQIQRYALTKRKMSSIPSAVMFASEIPSDTCAQRPTMGRRKPSATCLSALLGSSTLNGLCTAGGGAEYDLDRSYGRREGEDVGQSQERREKVQPKPRRLISSALLLGGAMVLTNGAAPLGAKVVVACVLKCIIRPQKSLTS